MREMDWNNYVDEFTENVKMADSLIKKMLKNKCYNNIHSIREILSNGDSYKIKDKLLKYETETVIVNTVFTEYEWSIADKKTYFDVIENNKTIKAKKLLELDKLIVIVNQ